MPLLDDIATRLETELSLATVYTGNMPDTPDAVVTVYEYGGLEPEYTLGTTPKARRPRIQVACRGAIGDYAAARTQAEAAYTAMIFNGTTLSGTAYFRSEPIDEPFPLERDANDRWIIVFNAQIWRA